MNDIFFGPLANLIGRNYDLANYFELRFIPTNTPMIQLNLGFMVVQVFSWEMTFTIYGRIALIFIMIRAWKIRANERCVNVKTERQKT
jgi:hypothetical protein